MATKTIMWGDGTPDKITVTFSGAVGSSKMAVSSDKNLTLSRRQTIIKLKISGATVGTLTVDQGPRTRAFSVAYSEAYK